LSPLALHDGPFRAVADVAEELGPEPASGIAVLDRSARPSGDPNFNHAMYVRAARVLQHDALWALLHYPRTYGRASAQALSIFFQPTYQYPHDPTLRENLVVLKPLTRVIDAAHGLWNEPSAISGVSLWPSAARTGWLMAVFYIALHALAAWTLLRRSGVRDQPLEGAMTYAWLLSAYTVLVGVLVQAGENNRFRFTAEPLVLMLLMYVGRQAIRADVAGNSADLLPDDVLA
jgi:hypothetical protein